MRENSWHGSAICYTNVISIYVVCKTERNTTSSSYPTKDKQKLNPLMLKECYLNCEMKHLKVRKCQKASYPCNVKYGLLQCMLYNIRYSLEVLRCLMSWTFNGTQKPG